MLGVVLLGVLSLGVLSLGAVLLGVLSLGVVLVGVVLGSVSSDTELVGPVDAGFVAGVAGALDRGVMSSNEVLDRFAAKTGMARPMVAIPTMASVTGCFMTCSFIEVWSDGCPWPPVSQCRGAGW